MFANKPDFRAAIHTVDPPLYRDESISQDRLNELMKIGKIREYLVQRRDKEKQAEYDEWYHQKPKDRKWNIGDAVLVQDRRQRPGSKFELPLMGPFRIYQTLPNGNVRLSDMNGTPSLTVINGNRLKLYHMTEPGGSGLMGESFVGSKGSRQAKG